MAELNAYLKFQGNCKEAMTFYNNIFGGSLNVMTNGESPVKDQMPAELHDQVMHAVMTSDRVMVMGSDMMGKEGYVHGTTVSLCIVCKSKEEIEALFAGLSEGGTIEQPLKEEFFGTYGALVDKYGFSWMFQYGVEPTVA